MVDATVDKSALVDRFKAFVETMDIVKTTHGSGENSWTSSAHRKGVWWFADDPGFDDFNKEIYPSGANKALPDGACGIRADDDFWTVAIFPFEFCALTIQEMVAVLWPHIEKPVFHADVDAYLTTGEDSCADSGDFDPSETFDTPDRPVTDHDLHDEKELPA